MSEIDEPAGFARRARQRTERRRTPQADRFEREEAEFHERVREAYLKIAKSDPSRWLILDASLSPAQLLQVLVQELKTRKWLR